MFKSCAKWPKEVYTNKYGNSISTDKHFSEDEAHAVCRGLMTDGFGGDGKYFPLKTWVEEISSDDIQSCFYCCGDKCDILKASGNIVCPNCKRILK